MTCPTLNRLAQRLHLVAGGSPLHTIELVRQLVERGLIRYVDGIWLIPDDLGADTLPAALSQALAERVAALTEPARRTGELLAVHGKPISLDLIVQLTGDRNIDEVFAALDELLEREVLVGSAGTYRLRHDGLREALLGQIEPERLRELHRRIGDALDVEETPAAELEARVGWHLLRGGRLQRGADLLERAGRRLFSAQSFTDAIEPLEAAFEVRRGERAAPRDLLQLQQMLLLSGCMSNREVALRYIEPVIDGYRHYAGLGIAERAARVIGRHAGLLVGLLAAALRWLFTRRRRRGPGPLRALTSFIVAVGYSATVYSLSYDLEPLRRLLQRIEPLAVFRRKISYALWLLTENLLAFPLGQFGRVRSNATELLGLIEHARRSRFFRIDDIELRTGEAGVRFMLTLVAVSEQDPAFARQLERLAALDLRYFELGALQARIAFRRCRGEEDLARRLQAQAEVLLVQLGSAWQMEAWLAVVSSLAYAITRDVLGLKRSIEELGSLVARGYRFEAALALARGEYHRERGEIQLAHAQLEQTLELAPPDANIIRQPALAALAETHLAAGEPEQAAQVAADCAALGSDPDIGQLANRLRANRARALAESQLDQYDAAVARLDRAIEEAAPLASPSLCGSLHQARALVALASGDHAAYLWHQAETDRHFKPTRNPALIARAQRLADAGAAHGDRARRRRPTTGATSMAVTTSIPEPLLPAGRDSHERSERALELLRNASRATAGYLYLIRESAPVLVAPDRARNPPRSSARRCGRS